MHIYPLEKNKPIVIPILANHPKIVITDGFHHTKPLELVFHHIHTYYFKVVCAIDDYQLVAGSVLLLLLFFIGLVSGSILIQIGSFSPILYFLFLFYINRHEFIQIRPT
ncbi:MAG: hypothetical protein M3342_11155 [Bacteroidota bacterium]|nr:hypothetical protein [Flavisolibacter sp.]MDQ3844554.1 hypothetical protein [Bacteroidota bacterium]